MLIYQCSTDRPLAAMPSLTTREPSRRFTSATAVVHSPAIRGSKFVTTAVPVSNNTSCYIMITFTIWNSRGRICLFTMQLLWGYDDD